MASELEMQEAEDAIDRHRDRIAELEAEVERLTKELNEWKAAYIEACDHYSDLASRVASLSRTGAVKVKALTWSVHPAGGEQALGAGLGLYRVHANGDDWYLVPDHMGTGGKAAAQADYERRILSTLEPAEPEGEQDVPAFECGSCGYTADPDCPICTPPPRTRPSEQAVTEALPQDVIDLVIAARIVAFEDQSPEKLHALDKASEAFASRVPWDDDPEALKAAMEAGG